MANPKYWDVYTCIKLVQIGWLWIIGRSVICCTVFELVKNVVSSRRGFLKSLGGGALGLASASAFSSPLPLSHSPERQLRFYNLHTGERLSATYWADGHYVPDVMQELNYLLRDHRCDEVMAMDPRLFDMLHLIQQDVGVQKEFHVISGYRSPETNAMLNQKSSKVAKKSFHMLGKAIDIRVPGVPLKNLRQQARSLQLGGVGFYQRSNFVHVDVGPVRAWGG